MTSIVIFITLVAVVNFAVGFASALVLAEIVSQHDDHDPLLDPLADPVDATEEATGDAPSESTGETAGDQHSDSPTETPVPPLSSTETEDAAPTRDQEVAPPDATGDETLPAEASDPIAEPERLLDPASPPSADALHQLLENHMVGWQNMAAALGGEQQVLAGKLSAPAEELRGSLTSAREMIGKLPQMKQELLAGISGVASTIEEFSLACGPLEIMLGSVEDTCLEELEASGASLADEQISAAAGRSVARLGTLQGGCENIATQLGQLMSFSVNTT